MPPPLSRRAALAGLGAVLLAGCGPHELPAAPPLPGTAGGSPPPSPSPSPSPTPSVTVDGADGPVAVPGGATRVITLDTAELDSAITLGIPPVGAAKAPLAPGLPDYWPASWLARIAVVGDIGDPPDPVAIASLRPQLILSNRTRDAAHLNLLRGLAPTVLTQTTGAPWKENFHLHAEALDRREQAAAVVAAYARHLDQSGRALAAAGLTGQHVSLVRFVEGSPTVRLYARQNFPGSVLADLGLPRPDPQNTDQFAVETAPDQLARADGDVLFYAGYGDPDRNGLNAALASPAWRTLGAVRAHRAFPVDDRLWFQGIGYTGAHFLIADLLHILGAG
ncbi:ABC transporter substrate-binding protein [Kitasatospora cheerisanensis]|uniref:Putative ABC transporter substrate-binding protein n=1 Tax=Kitasatospora cheerisanensis KCTC 2395 TaxID=1348663 RepID=A0A066YRA7_9ACTN|nr:ABC transporter substrate-binding protein [Kitasatospora cheerisanensis]KDN83737.1 putative ABC transporter substrate-binding protein [Kitasatospora cheerisanensis KCTC 2395]